MLFRPHRSSLTKSMADCVSVLSVDGTGRKIPTTKAALVTVLQVNGYSGATKKNVVVKPYPSLADCYDSRNDWDTYLVTIDGQGVGFTDGPVTEN